MGFGVDADFQDAVRKRVARLLQIEDIVEENDEKIDREEAIRILELYYKFGNFEADKDYRMQSYKEV